jgi:hypothetical protein
MIPANPDHDAGHQHQCDFEPAQFAERGEVGRNNRRERIGLGEDIFGEPLLDSRAYERDQQQSPDHEKQRLEPSRHGSLGTRKIWTLTLKRPQGDALEG